MFIQSLSLMGWPETCVGMTKRRALLVNAGMHLGIGRAVPPLATV